MVQHQEPSAARVPPLWPYLALCALVGVLIDLGSVHEGEYADSLVTILISLQRWTPFYWEQNRSGMLVPLLALPFHDPLANLLVQSGIDAFCALAASFLLSRYLLRDPSYPVVALAGVAGFLALTPAGYRFEFLVKMFHGVWLALGLAALVLLEPGARHPWVRRGVALALMAAAHWVYVATVVYLGPLAVFRYLFSRPARLTRSKRRAARQELFGSLAVLALGALGGMLLMRVERQPTNLADSRWVGERLWWFALVELIRNTRASLTPLYWPLFLALVAGTGLLLLGVPAVRRHAAVAVSAAATLAAAGLVSGVFMASRAHVLANRCNFRYAIPSVFFWEAALLVLGLAPLSLAAGPRVRRALSAAGAALVVAAALVSYGWPSVSGVRAALLHPPGPPGDPRAALDVADLLAARCTHIAGDYWKVWPAVYRVNLARAERGDRAVVWGVTYRSRPTQPLWAQVPLEETRLAVPAGGDPEADLYLQRFEFPPLVVVEKRPTIWVLRPRDVVLREMLPF
jgi:hypothetical protein